MPDKYKIPSVAAASEDNGSTDLIHRIAADAALQTSDIPVRPLMNLPTMADKLAGQRADVEKVADAGGHYEVLDQPQKLAQAAAQKDREAKATAAYAQTMQQAKASIQTAHQLIDQKAWQQAREDNPGASDADISGYQAIRKQALLSQVMEQQKAVANKVPDNQFSALVGTTPKSIVAGRDKSMEQHLNENLGALGEVHGTDKIAAGAGLVGGYITEPFTHKGQFDESFARNDDGTWKPEFKQQVDLLAGGDMNKYAAAAKAIYENKVAEYDAAPAVAAQFVNSALEYLHKVPIVYHAAAGTISGIKAAVKTGAFLGHMLKPGSDEQYAATNKAIDQYSDQSASEGKTGNVLLDFLDNTAGGATRLIGQVGALEGLSPTPGMISSAIDRGAVGAEINAATLGNGSIWANTPANKAFTLLAKGLNGLSETKVPQVLDNLVSGTSMFYPSLYHDYYADALAKGYSPAQAENHAAQRAVYGSMLMSVGSWAAPSLKGQAAATVDDVLHGVEKEVGKGFMGKVGYFGQQAIKRADLKNAAIGGAGMGASAMGDAYQDYTDAIDRGDIPQDTPFDATHALHKAAESALVGFLSMGTSHLIGGHGKLTSTPQATGLYAAVADQRGFRVAVDRQVRKGNVTPEQGAAVKALVDRIAPEVQKMAPEISAGMKPEVAVQRAVEKARKDDAAQEYARLQQQTNTVRTIDANGKTTDTVYGLDPEKGEYTRAYGEKIADAMQGVKAQADASEKALKQLDEGSYVHGRSVSGDELLRITGKSTPDGNLTTEQAKGIMDNGPFVSEARDISEYAKDPKVAEYVKDIKAGKLDFKPQHANDPIIATDGSIIDGRKRIAKVLADGFGIMDVMRPQSMPEIVHSAQESYDTHLGSVEPVAANTPHAEVVNHAREAYESALDREPTEEDQKAGLTTPAVRAIADAAHVINEAGLPQEEAKQALRDVHPAIAPDAAEHFLNIAAEAKPVESVFDKEAPASAPQERERLPQPTAEQQRQALAKWYGNDPAVTESDLWDREAGLPKEGVTRQDIENHLFPEDISSPSKTTDHGQRQEGQERGLLSPDPAQEQSAPVAAGLSNDVDTSAPHETEAPEVVSLKQEVTNESDEPTASALEHRTADEVEESESRVAGIESAEKHDNETGLVAGIEAADKFISQPTSEIGTGSAARTDEQPAGREPDSYPGEQASVVSRIGEATGVSGTTHYYTSDETITNAGWSKRGEGDSAGIQDYANFLRNKFSASNVAIVDNAQARKLSGGLSPDAWVENDTVFINIEHEHLRPTSLLEESAHLWLDFMRTHSAGTKVIHDKGIALAQDTPKFRYMKALIENGVAIPEGLSAEEVKECQRYVNAYKDYPDPLYALANEVLAKAIRTEGKDLTSEPDAKRNFGKWLQSFWTSVKEKLGFSNLNTVTFAQLKLKDFSRRAAEEIGSGRELTKRIAEERSKAAIRAEKQAARQNEGVMDDLLDAAGNKKATAPLEGYTVEKVSDKDEPLTQDPVINAIGRGGGDEMADIIRRKAPTTYKAMVAAVGEESLVKALENPLSAPQEVQDALGVSFKKSRGALEKTLQPGLLSDALTALSKTWGGQHMPTDVVNGLKEYHKEAARRVAAHEEAVNRGRENQQKGVESKREARDNKFVADLSKAMQEGKVQYQRDIDALARKHGVASGKVAKLVEAATNKAYGEQMYSLPQSPKDERESTLNTLKDAADDTEHFYEEALPAIRSAYQNGIIDRETALDLHRKVVDSVGDAAKIKAFMKYAEKTLLPENVKESKPGAKVSGIAERVKSAAGTPTEPGKGWSPEQANEVGKQLIKEGIKPQDVLDEFNTNGGKVNGYMMAVANQHASELARLSDRAADEFGPNSKQAKDAAQVQQDWLDKVQPMQTEWQKIGAAQQGETEIDTGSFTAMKNAREKSKGSPLTEAEIAEAAKKAAQVKKLQEENKALQKKVSDLLLSGASEDDAKESKQAVTKKVNEEAKKRPITRAANVKEAVSDEGHRSIINSARERYQALKSKGMFSLPEPERRENAIPDDAELHKFIRAAVNDLITKGIRDVDTIMDAVAFDLDFIPDVTARDVADVYSGYGKATLPKTDELSKAKSEVRQLARIGSATEDVESGLPPLRTGHQPGEKPLSVREAEENLRRLIKESGIATTDPATQMKSAEDAARRALSNEIEALNKEIDTHTRREVPSPTPITNPEILALRAERDRLRHIRDVELGKPTMSDEQKMALIVKTLERANAAKRERIAKGDIEPNGKPESNLTNDKIEQLKKEGEQLSQEIADMRKAANPPKTKEQLATDAAMRSTQKRIEELDDLISSNTLKAGGKKSLVQETPELKALRAERDKKQEEYDKMWDAAHPKKTEQEIATTSAIKAAQRRIKVLGDMLDNNKLEGEEKKSFVDETNQMLIEARDKRDELQKELDARRKEARDAAAKSPEEKATDAAIKSKQTQLDEVNRRIQEHDLFAAKKQSLVDKNNSDLQDAEAALKSAKETLAQMRDVSHAEDLAERLADKTDNKFSPKDASDIWRHMRKQYLEKDVDINTAIANTATDLGLSPKQVRDAVLSPKVKPISDEMYKKQAQLRAAIQYNKDWASADNTPKALKAIRTIPKLFFAAKVFGHGTVGMITHAGANLFDPMEWKRWFPSFIKQFQFAYGSEAKYEQAIQDHINDPAYTFWKRNGLAIDPSKRYDDYQFITRIYERMGRVGRVLSAGDRGFEALKVYRLARAKAIYDNLSNVEKADPKTAKYIADLVNNSTGTASLKVSDVANTVFFAPNLELSRWNRLVTHPAQALSTFSKFSKWSEVPASEKVKAKIVAQRAGRMLATYVGALAVNQALLALFGSKQDINFLDPNKSDWLRFKAGDQVIDPSGGMASTLTFLTSLAYISLESKDDLGYKNRGDQLYDKVKNYGTGKFSPFASTVKDVVTQHDFSGNTLPWSDDKPYHKYNDNLTWAEYLERQQLPIPFSEAFNDIHDQMKGQGMSEADINIILKGIFAGAASGSTGVRVHEDYQTGKHH